MFCLVQPEPRRSFWGREGGLPGGEGGGEGTQQAGDEVGRPGLGQGGAEGKHVWFLKALGGLLLVLRNRMAARGNSDAATMWSITLTTSASFGKALVMHSRLSSSFRVVLLFLEV